MHIHIHYTDTLYVHLACKLMTSTPSLWRTQKRSAFNPKVDNLSFSSHSSVLTKEKTEKEKREKE